MSTVELTEQNFEKTLADNEIVLVDWWATWCGPCRQFAPVYEEVSGQHEDIVFGKIDTEAQPNLAASAQITSIPTIMAFRQGILLFEQSGALPAAALEDVIRQVRELDMDAVRRDMAAQQAAQQAGTGEAPSARQQGPDDNGAVV